MAVYLLVATKAHDLSWVAEYQANVPAIMAIMRKHGGEYFAVSENIKRYEGDGPNPDRIAIFTFPSMEKIEAFRTLTIALIGRHGLPQLPAMRLPSLLAVDGALGKAGGMIKARVVPVPSDSVLAPLYVGADLLDAFAIHLPAGASGDLEVLARVAFERQAGWIRALTWVRDAVMATVGVKSSRAIGAAAAARGLQVIGYLPLLSKSAGELVMGGDDRHLDFRAAILLRTGAARGRELVVVTVVHCHNRLGRTYLAVIAPFHRTILLANLERAVRVMEG